MTAQYYLASKGLDNGPLLQHIRTDLLFHSIVTSTTVLTHYSVSLTFIILCTQLSLLVLRLVVALLSTLKFVVPMFLALCGLYFKLSQMYTTTHGCTIQLTDR